MAFFSKVGNILKQSASKQITSQFLASNPFLYQALRCMSSSKLFIGGLPYAVDDTSLREAFSNYGEVIEARVIVDRESNRSRGFGFVTFASTEEASSAIQAMDGQDLHGRRVRVNYAAERQPRQFGGGYSGGGYGGGGYGGGGFGGGGYGGGGFGGAGGSPYGGGSGGPSFGQSAGGGYGGGAPAGGQYGGGSGGPSFGQSAGGGYGSAGNVNSYGGGNYGVAGGSDSHFGGGGSSSNVTAETGFASSGFGEEGSGLRYGGADQLGSDSTNAANDNAGDFDSSEPQEGNYRDEDEPDDYVKRA